MAKVTGILIVKQHWLLKTLCSRGLIGMALLWLIINVAPVRWLFRCSIE